MYTWEKVLYSSVIARRLPKKQFWNDDGADYKRAYKNLLQNDIMQKCSLVLLGLPPPTQCSSDSCRFGDPDSTAREPGLVVRYVVFFLCSLWATASVFPRCRKVSIAGP